MLDLEKISRSVGGYAVLSEISLSLQASERVAILGPTGSGKTSLLRLIMGLDAPDSGELRLDGQPLASARGNLVVPERRGFSLVFDQTLLLPHLDVAANILIGADRDDPRARARLQVLLGLLRLEALRSRSVASLSGGERQRVALARALLVQPRLLLLDEPFRNIDRIARDQLLPALQDHLTTEGIAAILVTHDRAEAFSFGQRILLLRDGRLVRGDSPERLYRHPTSSWDARLLGECNVLSTAIAQQVLGYQPRADDVEQVLIRPEHLEVRAEEPHNATLQESRYFGFYRSLTFRVQDDVPVQVKVLADEEYPLDQPYQLRLKDPALAGELPARSADAARAMP